MKQRLIRGVIATVGVTLAIAAPAGAALTPRGNSAVMQYSESFPTVEGPRQSGDATGNARSPSRVLGSGNARRLARLGAAGQEAAETAAKTAPPRLHEPVRRTPLGKGTEGNRDVAAGGGSSGLGEILGQATGLSSSGNLGPALPLMLLAALTTSLAYLWRRLRHEP